MQLRPGRRPHHSAAPLAARWVAAAAAAAAAIAQAGPLADPTRPPAALATLQPQLLANSSSGVGAAPALRSVAASAPTAAPATVPQSVSQSVLQSVQLPVHGTAVAMVDGRLVKVGDMVGRRMVLTIDSQGLVLRGDTGVERLWLLAGSSKQAPGSIVTTHAVSFVPVPQVPDPALEIDARARPERSSAGPLQPGPGAALSLAGRTQP